MKITPLENWIMEKACFRDRSREALEEYQLFRLRETLNYVKNNSRFYGELLRNINPYEIHNIEEVRNIPFTFPHVIQKDPFQLLCVPQSEIKRIVTLKSTGTSGKEKRLLFSEEDLNQTIDFFVHGMSCLINEADRVMVLLPGSSYGSIGDLLGKALARVNIECYVHGVVTDPEETAQEIIKRNITCIVGIPTQVLYLSRVKSEIFKSKIRTVLLSTDYVPEVLIGELTDQSGCSVFTHYGMTEMGYGGGVECEALSGYHMREADFYFEIVDPDTGNPVPDGQFGEVVFTTLTRNAMPLIRYRTGDVACFASSPCACGTFLKTMNRVQGRIDNRIRIRDNEYLNLNELDEVVFSLNDVKDYTACLLTDNYLNLEVVTESEEIFQRIKNEIAEHIQNYVKENFEHTFNMKVNVTSKNETERITSSAAKRTICDLRTAK